MKLWMLAAAALVVTAANADPLANAREGQLQCYKPDTARKSCGALSGYTFNKDGSISNQAQVLLSPQPLVTMRTVSPVSMKGEAVCGVARKQDIDTATILVDGSPLPEDKAVEARNQISAAMQGLQGQEICTTYVAEGDHLITKITMNGQPKPEFTQTVIWVKPTDGYTVSP